MKRTAYFAAVLVAGGLWYLAPGLAHEGHPKHLPADGKDPHPLAIQSDVDPIHRIETAGNIALVQIGQLEEQP